MSRERLRLILLTLLAVAALAIVAGTMVAPQPTDSEIELPDRDEPPPAEGPELERVGFCEFVFDDVRFTFALGVVFLVGSIHAYRATGSVAIPALGIVPIAAALASVCLPNLIGPFAPLEGFGIAVPRPPLDVLVILSLALIALVGAAVLVYVSRGESVSPVKETDSGADVRAAAAAAAGRAADRIEANADIDNAVYRAWKEMTDHLDVASPETSTPGEFAAAAVDAGMADDDVEVVTALFEAVRYGGRDVEGREERAVAALRRIERTYGGVEG